MSLPPDPERGSGGNCWFRAQQTAQYCTVRSKVGWFMGHWSPKRRASLRCLADLCPICKAGSEPRPFYYIAVSVEDQKIVFFEIPRRLRLLAERLDSSPNGGVGSVLAISKNGAHYNSTIEVVNTGYQECEEFDIWPFVSTLGQGLLPVAADATSSRPIQSESFPEEEARRVAAM